MRMRKEKKVRRGTLLVRRVEKETPEEEDLKLRRLLVTEEVKWSGGAQGGAEKENGGQTKSSRPRSVEPPERRR